MATDQTIPVASLNDFLAGGARRNQFVQTVGEALVDVGFFALCDHGVNTSLIDAAYRTAEQFFRLDVATKQAYEVPGGNGQRGYISYGREHAKNSKAPDLKEFWHVGQELPPDHSLTSFYPQNLWPKEVSGFRETFLSLFMQLESCAFSVLEACALFINEAQDTFSKAATAGDSILRVIHYPPIPADADPQSIRAAAHEDINLITLLCEATTGGLELLERNGSWRPIHALKGQIVVDSGDMLQNITNGYYRSTTHRVVNPDNSRERRFSMPFFVHPKSAVSLDPLASCVAKTGSKKAFPAITAGEYLAQRLREIGLGSEYKSK